MADSSLNSESTRVPVQRVGGRITDRTMHIEAVGLGQELLSFVTGDIVTIQQLWRPKSSGTLVLDDNYASTADLFKTSMLGG